MADSERPVWERHLQTVLLSLLVLGVGIVGKTLSEVREDLTDQEVIQAATSERVQALTDRIDGLAADRYTGTQAAQDRLQMIERMTELSGDLRDTRTRLRALEQEVARAHGAG